MTYLGKETRFTWYGHSTFLIETPSGKRVMIDPWLEGNPSGTLVRIPRPASLAWIVRAVDLLGR